MPNVEHSQAGSLALGWKPDAPPALAAAFFSACSQHPPQARHRNGKRDKSQHQAGSPIRPSALDQCNNLDTATAPQLWLTIQASNRTEAREAPVVKNPVRRPEGLPQVRVISTQATQQQVMEDEFHDCTDDERAEKDC